MYYQQAALTWRCKQRLPSPSVRVAPHRRFLPQETATVPPNHREDGRKESGKELKPSKSPNRRRPIRSYPTRSQHPRSSGRRGERRPPGRRRNLAPEPRRTSRGSAPP